MTHDTRGHDSSIRDSVALAHATARRSVGSLITMATNAAVRGVAGGLIVMAAGFQPAAAQGTGRVGTVIVAHGGDSLWNSRVLGVAQAVRTSGPVEVSFLMGPAAQRTRFQDAVARLRSQNVSEVVVVPMLVSSYSGHYDQIRWLAGENIALDTTMMHHLHMSGITRPAAGVPIRLARAMDDASQVARVLADRALFIVGHGPNSAEDYAAWMKNLRPVADSVKRMTGFRDVRVDLVRDDAPAEVRAEAVRRMRELIELQHLITGREVIVVPVLVSKGTVSRDRVPADLAGLPVVYAGEPLLPHPAMARWVEERVRTIPQAPPR